jgi:hypothetical protein
MLPNRIERPSSRQKPEEVDAFPARVRDRRVGRSLKRWTPFRPAPATILYVLTIAVRAVFGLGRPPIGVSSPGYHSSMPTLRHTWQEPAVRWATTRLPGSLQALDDEGFEPRLTAPPNVILQAVTPPRTDADPYRAHAELAFGTKAPRRCGARSVSGCPVRGRTRRPR